MSEVQGAQAVDRAVRILQAIATRNANGVRIADLMQATGLSNPTVHRLVKALLGHGLLQREESSGVYRLGCELTLLGSIAGSNSLETSARPSMVSLAQFSGDRVILQTRRNWRSVCIAMEEGDYPIQARTIQIGDRFPMGVTAGGLAMLATLSDSEIEDSLSANAKDIAKFPEQPPSYIREQIALTRERGFAFNAGKMMEHSFCVGVPICRPDGEAFAALSIAALFARLDMERAEELAQRLHAEARAITNATFRVSRVQDLS